jgi:hypothetical protein
MINYVKQLKKKKIIIVLKDLKRVSNDIKERYYD